MPGGEGEKRQWIDSFGGLGLQVGVSRGVGLGPFITWTVQGVTHLSFIVHPLLALKPHTPRLLGLIEVAIIMRCFPWK